MRTDFVESVTSGDGLAYPLSAVAIERRSAITREEFAREYMTGLCRPVIVRDAMDDWRARDEWTFDFFAKRYGDRRVVVTDRLVRPTTARRVSFSEYMVYCQMPFMTALGRVPTPTPFYLTGLSPFSDDPELLDSFSDPYFIENQYRQLSGPLLNWYFDNFSWLFIGPKGTVSPLHVDLFGTHAWLAQLEGRKHFLLFSPEDAGFLYEGQVDLFHPDLERFPLIEKARPVEAVLEPGEVIFIPARWAHQVISLDPSISLTMNFVAPANFVSHVMAICRDLPLWVKRIDTPAFRQANGIRWNTQDLAPAAARQEEE
jgi:Cupin-like domain